MTNSVHLIVMCYSNEWLHIWWVVVCVLPGFGPCALSEWIYVTDSCCVLLKVAGSVVVSWDEHLYLFSFSFFNLCGDSKDPFFKILVKNILFKKWTIIFLSQFHWFLPFSLLFPSFCFFGFIKLFWLDYWGWSFYYLFETLAFLIQTLGAIKFH